MSKREVLTQIYPDELEYIFQKKREAEIQRYEDYRHMMMAVAAGFGSKTEDGETLFEIYSRQLDEIIGKLEGVKTEKVDIENEYTENHVHEQFDKLKELQEIIASTAGKRG